MSLTLITPPAHMPVSTAEVGEHLRLDEPQLLVVDVLIGAATDYLDGPEGVLNRALITQTWDLKLDCFPWAHVGWSSVAGSAYVHDCIKIPLPPLVSVTHVKYIDPDGIEQTWPTTEYTVDVPNGQIYLAYGKSYPSTRDVPNAITVRFVAGYSVEMLPPADKLLVLALVAHWHEHREPVVVGQAPAQVPDYLDRLIAARRSWRAA
jgi:uncharacterized phiE125 gp8 family phage protein